jgi:hypothetical protein
MLFTHSPYRRQIAVLSAIIVVLGLIVWNANRDEYSTMSSEGSGMIAPSSYDMDLSKSEMVRESSNIAMEEMVAQRSGQPIPIVPPEYGNGSVAVDVPAEERLIVKNGSLSLLVDDVVTAVGAVQSFAFGQGGFVVSSNIDKSGSTPYGYVTIRIPSDVFDTGLGALRELGEVQNEHVDAQDVTEEYVDLEARLRNLQETESQLLSLMRQATKIEDILAVQRELTIIRSQIESLEGRMTYLRESASFSLLSVYLSNDPENLPIVDDADTWKPVATIKQAVRDLLDLGTGIVDGIIWVIIFLPVWIGIGLVLTIVTRVYKRYQK